MRIGHFCSECGEELGPQDDTCPQHPDAAIDSIEVEDPEA